jgi:outer membrane protein assembly factor BamE
MFCTRFSPLALVATALVTSGCGTPLRSADDFLGLITPYRIDIVQGNVVTKEQIALVKPGLTRSQVRDVLGSPMVTDVFNGNRWDYVFTIRRQGTEPQRRSIVVRFEADVVKSVEAPELPSEREFVASIAKPSSGKVPTLELSEAERKALPAPPPREQAVPEPVGAVREYPPLEPS